jgi:predicted phage tail protein
MSRHRAAGFRVHPCSYWAGKLRGGLLAIVQWLAVIVIFFVAPHPHWSTIVSSTVVAVALLTLYLRARRSRETP